MKKNVYKNRKCPTHKNCWGYIDGCCNDCDYGNEFIRLHKKVDRLKDKLEKAKIAIAYYAAHTDVVEVVRCKDCVHSGECELDTVPKDVLWCVKLHTLAHEIHYCSYGERRENGRT